MRHGGAAAAFVAAALLAGCGGSQPVPAAFSWVRHPAPAAWTRTALAGSSVTSIPFPPGWHTIHSDPGTVSAATPGPNGELRGYLNVTPQQGSEGLSGWARFRVAHNRDEGDRDVRIVTSAEKLPFATGTGSCVVDDYRTSRQAYREVACIVDGSHDTMVAVGAAPPGLWSHAGPLLERAIAGLRT